MAVIHYRWTHENKNKQRNKQCLEINGARDDGMEKEEEDEEEEKEE